MELKKFMANASSAGGGGGGSNSKKSKVLDHDWSSLQPELLKKIVTDGLTTNADHLSFRDVCRNWRSATPPPQHIPCQAPSMILVSCDKNTSYSETRYGGDFLNVPDNKDYVRTEFEKFRANVSSSTAAESQVLDHDWSRLPPELLDKIVMDGVTVNADYLRFRAVCRNWRFAAPSPQHLPCQIPWLMIPSCGEYTTSAETRYGGDFISLLDNKVYHTDDLPETKFSLRRQRCFGSSHGWLSFVDYPTLSLFIFNPLTKAHIQLPPIPTLPDLEYNSVYMVDSCFQKFILSESPTSSNSCIAMILYSEEQKMAFCRAGDNKWWPSIPNYGSVNDVIYHKGQFYSTDENGIVIVCNADPCDPKQKIIGYGIGCMYPWYGMRRYLVEASGELMMVVRHTRSGDSMYVIKTTGFYIFRYMPTSGEWIRVTSLKDWTLFLGINSSFSLSAKDAFPKGCKPNCIYFSDDDHLPVSYYGGHDLGIFNLEDGNIEPLPYYAANRFWIWPPPIWVTPSLS